MFVNESIFNILIRALTHMKVRLRGFFYKQFNMLTCGPDSKLIVHNGMRIRNGKKIFIKGKAKFGICSRLEVYPKSTGGKQFLIKIGDGFSCGDYFHIGAAFGIEIGKNVLIGSNVLIIDHEHGCPNDDLKELELVAPVKRELSGRPIIIEDNVWIGDGAILLKGAHVSEGAIIAASSIVRGRVKPRVIYKGRAEH